MITDYKHFGQRRRDKLLDDLATGVAWITATVVAVFYFLSLVPIS